MTTQEMAMHLWPCWLMGLIMVIAVLCSEHRDLLKVSFSGLGKFLKWMGTITALRFLLIKGAMLLQPENPMIANIKQMVHFIPWQATFGVFWEDAVHVMPLVILARMFGEKTWYKIIQWPLLTAVMVSFGSGHLYQGALAAAGISLYILVSKKMGEKHGFGTVMLCHIMYDMITLLTLAWIVGG